MGGSIIIHPSSTWPDKTLLYSSGFAPAPVCVCMCVCVCVPVYVCVSGLYSIQKNKQLNRKGDRAAKKHTEMEKSTKLWGKSVHSRIYSPYEVTRCVWFDVIDCLLSQLHNRTHTKAFCTCSIVVFRWYAPFTSCFHNTNWQFQSIEKTNTCIITNCLVKWCVLCNLLCLCVVSSQF